MGHRIDLVMVHNGGANAYRAGTLRTSTFSNVPSSFFLNMLFAAVIGNIDKEA